jgi:hypothetical protein
MVQEEMERLTIPRIHIQHLLDNEHFLLPIILPPAKMIRSISISWTGRDILETPASVIPNPIDLGMCF